MLLPSLYLDAVQLVALDGKREENNSKQTNLRAYEKQKSTKIKTKKKIKTFAFSKDIIR